MMFPSCLLVLFIVFVNSRNDKGKALKEHILKDIVPPGFDARIEEIQEKHWQAIEEEDEALALLNDDLQGRDSQIQAPEFTNKEEPQAHQQEILRLNEEINNLLPNRHVARRGCFDNVLCFIKEDSRDVTHSTLFDVSIGSWKNISDGLDFVTQTWRWLTNVMIQMPFTDGVDLSVKW